MDMKNILKGVLTFLEYVALIIVVFYGIKYAVVAGPIFFGSVAGAVVSAVIVFLAALHIVKKEGGYKDESKGIKGIK